jgi:triosephosphate isomerase (TIM)
MPFVPSIETNLIPILCIGETKEEYELGLNEETCTAQLGKDLEGLTGEQVAGIVIAYEPVCKSFHHVSSGISYHHYHR